MASIIKRNNRFCVVYHYLETDGQRKQKWETFKNMTEAKLRLKEVEYKEQLGTFIVPKCKTVNELMDEYIALYGRNKWALSTYNANTSVVRNYIRPIIGDRKLTEITPRFLERYYQQLLRTRPVVNPKIGRPHAEFVTTGTIKEIHKILRGSLNEAVKWELIEKNPALNVMFRNTSMLLETSGMRKRCLRQLIFARMKPSNFVCIWPLPVLCVWANYWDLVGTVLTSQRKPFKTGMRVF